MCCKLQRTTAEACTIVCTCKADTLGTPKALPVKRSGVQRGPRELLALRVC